MQNKILLIRIIANIKQKIMNNNLPKKKLITLILIFICFVANAQTQFELEQKTCNDYGLIDSELNKVYKRIISLHSIDSLFIKNLKYTQNNWIKLRDSDLSLYMLDDYNYGTVYRICKCQFLIELTKQRIEFLKKWSEGYSVDRWICGGTTKKIGQSDEEFKKKLKFEVEYERD